jgi:malonate-semialdehyde dehydrogenase (acetylating)/methylmalonate-semialdehyde dehydrogenase
VGSTPIGRIVYQKASMKGIRAQCNMGAKNHAVIMPDCNKELTLQALTAAAFGATGQRCMAISVAVFVSNY